jgi:hypothetical protein
VVENELSLESSVLLALPEKLLTSPSEFVRSGLHLQVVMNLGFLLRGLLWQGC